MTHDFNESGVCCCGLTKARYEADVTIDLEKCPGHSDWHGVEAAIRASGRMPTTAMFEGPQGCPVAGCRLEEGHEGGECKAIIADGRGVQVVPAWTVYWKRAKLSRLRELLPYLTDEEKAEACAILGKHEAEDGRLNPILPATNPLAFHRSECVRPGDPDIVPPKFRVLDARRFCGCVVRGRDQIRPMGASSWRWIGDGEYSADISCLVCSGTGCPDGTPADNAATIEAAVRDSNPAGYVVDYIDIAHDVFADTIIATIHYKRAKPCP